MATEFWKDWGDGYPIADTWSTPLPSHTGATDFSGQVYITLDARMDSYPNHTKLVEVSTKGGSDIGYRFRSNTGAPGVSAGFYDPAWIGHASFSYADDYRGAFDVRFQVNKSTSAIVWVNGTRAPVGGSAAGLTFSAEMGVLEIAGPVTLHFVRLYDDPLTEAAIEAWKQTPEEGYNQMVGDSTMWFNYAHKRRQAAATRRRR